MPKQNPHNRYLKNFVEKLHKLNEVTIELSDKNVNEIIKNPKKYAFDVIVKEFSKNLPNMVKAYDLGETLAMQNLRINYKDDKRFYPDGEKVPKKLPEGYAIGRNNQACNNCHYFIGGDYCKKWKADVRGKYWCKSWEAEDHNG